MRDAEKGPLTIEIVRRRVVAKIDRKVGDEETLVVIRRMEDGVVCQDYYLSNAPAATLCDEFGRVAKAEHRIEECLERGKSEAGLSDYQVRTWLGWHHHITLSHVADVVFGVGIATGKKMDAGRSRCRKYASVLRNTCDEPAAATSRSASCENASIGLNASNLQDFIIIKHLTNYHHESFINVDDFIQ